MFDVALFEFEGVLFETTVARRESLRRALADADVAALADLTRAELATLAAPERVR